MMLDFPLMISGGNENAARYFPLCCWYIYSAGEPDRPVVICDLKPSCLSLEGVDVLELLDMHESDEARARLLIDGMENFVGMRKTFAAV